MAKKLSPLVATVELNLNKWTAGIKQLGRDQQALEKALKPIGERAKQLGTIFAATGLAVGGAMLAMAKKAADYGDAMLEASQKTGIGTKQLSALKLIAEQSGSSFEGITGGVTRLSKSLVEAATKGGEAAKTFSALGISVKDAGGDVRQASDVLPEIADRFAKMKDGTEKTALAMRLFGKAGADLIPILNKGSGGFKEAIALIEKYSVDMEDAGNVLSDTFNDKLGETQIALQGLANQIGKAVLPAMIRFVEIGNNVIAMVSRWAKENPGLTRTIAALAGVMTGTGGLLFAMSGFTLIAPKMISNLKLLAEGFLALSVPARVLVIALAALTGAFIAFPKIRGPVLEVLAVIASAVITNAKAFGYLAGVIGELAKGKFRDAWETFKDMGTNMEDIYNQTKKSILDGAAAIGDGLTEVNKALKGDPNVLGWAKDFSVDLDELGKAANKTADDIDRMWDSMKKENSEAEALTAVLMRASAAHIDYTQVLDKLGPTIADVADEFIKSGEPLPEIIAYYNSLRKSSIELAAAQEEELQSRIELNKAIFEGQQMMAAESANIGNVLMEHAREQIESVQVAHDELTQSVVDATANLGRQEHAIRQDAAAIVELSRRGMSATQIEAALGVSIERVTEAARELGIQLDPVTQKVMRQQSEAQKLSRSWEESFARISDELVDMIVDFDFSFRRLGDIAKNTAKDMARAFLDGFFKPFKDGLRDLGEKAGQWASGLIFGTKQATGGSGQQQGNGGLLGGLIGGGGILGGIFGSGGGVGAGGTPPFNPNAGGSFLGSLGLGGVLGGAGTLFSAIDSSVRGGWKPGQKAQNEGSKFFNDFFKAINDVQSSTLSYTNKLKTIDNLYEVAMAQIAQISGVDKNFAKAFAGTSSRITQAVVDKRVFLSPLAEQETQAAITGGSGNTYTHNGDVVFTFAMPADVTTPEKWLDWWDKNKAGIRARVAEGVFAMEGAIVTR